MEAGACLSDVRLGWRVERVGGARPLHRGSAGLSPRLFSDLSCGAGFLRPLSRAVCRLIGVCGPHFPEAGLRSSHLPVQNPSPHSLHLAFSDFARTRFKDVRSTMLTADETFYFSQDEMNRHVEEAWP